MNSSSQKKYPSRIINLILIIIIFSLFFTLPINVLASNAHPKSARGRWGFGYTEISRVWLNKRYARKYATQLRQYNTKEDLTKFIVSSAFGLIPGTKGSIGIILDTYSMRKEILDHNLAKRITKTLKHHVKGILIESLDSSIGGVHIVLVHKWNHKRTSVKKPTHTDYTIKKLRIKN